MIRIVPMSSISLPIVLKRPWSTTFPEFVNLIINYLTEHGVVEPGRVYESPFTAVALERPEGFFGSADVIRIFEVIDDFARAAA